MQVASSRGPLRVLEIKRLVEGVEVNFPPPIDSRLVHSICLRDIEPACPEEAAAT